MPDSPDLKNSDQTEIEAFAAAAYEPEIAAMLRQLLAEPDDAAIRVMVTLLGSRGGSLEEKPIPSQLAARALVLVGPGGVAVLRDALLDDERRVRYPSAVIKLLWLVSKEGRLDVTSTRVGDAFLVGELPPDTQHAATQAVRDIFARALEDPSAFSLVGHFAFEAGFSAAAPNNPLAPTASELMSLFGEANIRLSRAVLDQFREMIAENRMEEEYQRFLTSNPVLLDPLAAEVVPKQRLGLEYATDYAIRRHDDRWLLVEIERPLDPIFTKAGDFRKRFIHAFRQVLEFQSWVDNNIAYAQKSMPRIASPRGVLIMGLRKTLSEGDQAVLRRFADNSQRIEIYTFDDLLEGGESLYSSLRHDRN